MAQYIPWLYPAVGTIGGSLSVQTTSIPAATTGTFYSTTLEATGGTTPYAWALVAPNNVLPTGLSLNTSTGVISGTPTQTGAFSLTVRVTDNSASQATGGTLTLNVSAPSTALTVTTSSLTAANRGVIYSASLNATGGTTPYTWSLVAPNNVLPTGLSLNTSTGAITGTPTVAGSVSIQARVTDNVAATADSGLLTITVNQVADLTITTGSTLPQKEQNDATSSVTFASAGGWGAITWTKLSGDYPTGMTLSGATLSGTPSSLGTFVFEMQAEDSESRTDTKTFSLTVVAAGTAEGPHDYYNELVALPELLAGESLGHWSMRSSATIESQLGADGIAGNFWTYDPDNDDYPDKQDACKYVGYYSLGGNEQLRTWKNTTIPESLGTGKLLITLDFYWGRSFYDNVALSTFNHKFHQIADGGRNGAGSSIYCEPRVLYRPVSSTPPEFGRRDLRTYGTGLNIEGVTNPDSPYSPAGAGSAAPGSYPLTYEVWSRIWYELQLSQPGTAFTDWNTLYNGGDPIGTRDLTSSTGSVSINHIQLVTLSNIGAGDTFTLTFDGQTTAAIAFNDFTAEDGSANIKAALEALSNIGADDLTVRKNPTQQTYQVEFGGSLAGTTVPVMTRTYTGFSGNQPTTKMLPGTYTRLTLATGYDYWENDTLPGSGPEFYITIAGHSDAALNGVHQAWHLSPTSILVAQATTGGTGGTVSKHFHMFSWWQADENRAATRIHYRVPIRMRNTGVIKSFYQELNSSADADALRSWRIAESPTIANPTVITTNVAHDLVTGERVVILQNDQITRGQYPVTVIDSTHFSIPVNVTAPSTLITSGFHANTYGFISSTLIGYTRNLVMLRNYTIDEESSFLRQPVRADL